MSTKTDKLRRQLKKDQHKLVRAAADLVENDGSAADVEFALDRAEQLGKRLEIIPKVEKVNEPDLYERGGPNSYFGDLVASVSPTPVPGIDPGGAQARLAKHRQYEASRRRIKDEVAARAADRFGVQPAGTEYRDLSTSTGSGGEFTPPKWIVDQFASVVRAASPLRRLVTSLPLPGGTMQLVIPRVTVASGVVTESSQNVAVPESISDTDSVVAPVVTFVGGSLVSQQLFDRGFDTIATQDFANAFAADLESELVNGTGTGGHLLGLLNVSGTVANTYTDASPTPAKVAQAIAQTAALVGDARLRAPSVIVTRPSRYLWLAGSVDGSGNEQGQRVGTGPSGPLNARLSQDGPYGPIAGLPVYLDASLPSNLGSGSNQDAILAVKADDVLLLEDDPKFNAMVGTDDAGNLTVSLNYHVYASAFTQRYPTGIGVLTGSGLVAPEGW